MENGKRRKATRRKCEYSEKKVKQEDKKNCFIPIENNWIIRYLADDEVDVVLDEGLDSPLEVGLGLLLPVPSDTVTRLAYTP